MSNTFAIDLSQSAGLEELFTEYRFLLTHNQVLLHQVDANLARMGELQKSAKAIGDASGWTITPKISGGANDR